MNETAGEALADTMLRWGMEDECGEELNGWIYWIGCPEPQALKIGFTTKHPHARLKQLQTGSPVRLVLLGWYPGNQKQERELHSKLVDYKLSGEWFRIDPGMSDVLTADFRCLLINNALTGHEKNWAHIQPLLRIQ